MPNRAWGVVILFALIVLASYATGFVFFWKMRVDDEIEASFWKKVRFCLFDGYVRTFHWIAN
ncbi:MAG: hypothetical protein PHT40_02675 [Patescibacteria group bacterium]|nr:hypothetical protein [Patescibacteria group bacterium]